MSAGASRPRTRPSPRGSSSESRVHLSVPAMPHQHGAVRTCTLSESARLTLLAFRRCEWFKLLLSPESLRSGVPDPWLPPLPVGKNVVDVIADFLRCAWRYAKRMITEEIGSVVDLSASLYCFEPWSSGTAAHSVSLARRRGRCPPHRPRRVGRRGVLAHARERDSRGTRAELEGWRHGLEGQAAHHHVRWVCELFVPR